jgi:carboxymethylenebutenolidase
MKIGDADILSLRPLAALDRRAFMATALAGGYALATLPVAASAIHTSATGLQVGEVVIPVGAERLPAYVARPATSGPWPVVLVVQEIFGVHEHIRDVCRRFAQRGAMAIAPELFFRQGNPAAVADLSLLMREIVARVPDAQVMADLDATIAWARGEGAKDEVAVTGFCWGGRVTWLYAAHSARVKAGVAWYGRVAGQATALQPEHPVDLAHRLQAPVLGLYAGRDGGIPLDTVERMQAALHQAGVSAAANASQIIIYPEAQHGFYADYRASYRREDAEPAFEAACAWMQRHGVTLQPVSG